MLNPYRRSLLYVPGSRQRMLEKALDRSCDTLIIDLEDAVAPSEKALAREMTNAYLMQHERTKEIFVRVNDVESPYFEDDLKMAIEREVDAIVLPKANRCSVIEADRAMQRLEKSCAMHMMILIETAIGLTELREALDASERIIAVQFGAEDYTRDMEIARTKSGEEVLFARQTIGVVCKSRGIQAVDTPFVDYADIEGQEADISVAKRCGMKAKTCIHPAQLDAVNRLFMPSKEEIDFAHRVAAEAEKEENIRCGAFSLDGKMVDIPVIERAKKVIWRAKAYGLLEE